MHLNALLALTAATTALAKPSPQGSSTSSGSVPQVSVKGNAFYAGDKRFYVRGVAYQPGGSSNIADPIADVESCRRDVKKFEELGINTIRVYTVDSTANHDECMKLLADAGIYLALDVNSPKYSLNRADPEPSYNDVYLQSVFAAIDAFANYDNTLLFFSANEVINDNDTTKAAPWVKAVTRDMRQYIGSRGYRAIPVGYSAADVDENRFEMAEYMNCGTDDERSDFFAFNDYSWCPPSTFDESGWKAKVEQYSKYNIPLFLSEFGCNKKERTFEEVTALYSDKMTSVYSGGLVYEYSEEGSKYGLVQINGDEVSNLDDFDILRTALEGASPPDGDAGASTGGEASKCPAKSSSWEVGDDKLPAIPEPAMEYMEKGAGPGPGLSGDGSQNAGTGSSGTATPGSGKVTATATAGGGAGASSTAAAARSVQVPGWKGDMGMFMTCAVVLVSTGVGMSLL
ncbi:hypothetical protein P152DRAFT_391676 [Eremomyces bilateralis CBS 781.70]|uniref:1,3-beta-glucanosyltransferase n=1 Tax=Eremomyces bilateralis CBS 781.70 TaxID=1392243 RepID=A0A6G1GAL5_9PEZI|nr:uncharacterized protein P152DRAFT_391676 [Eremomyces bilateralis CBS 781.70]KAF1815128.1 hypothetical protein P152DRAFT_391676 [Eremomyces bilateralis CBS 781.70]